MISSRFIKSTFLYTASGALSTVASFLLLPFYTNYLGTSNYGTLALYISFSTIIQLVTTFSIDSALYLFHHRYKNDPGQIATFYGTVNTILFSAGAIALLFFALVGPLVFPLVIKDASADYYWLGLSAVLVGFLTTYFRVYGHVLILHERPGAYFFINVVNFILTIVISVIGVMLYKDSVIGPMFGRIFSYLGVFAVCIWMFSREFRPRFSTKMAKEILTAASPIFAYTVLLTIVSVVDLYILNQYLGKGQLGLYDLAMKCSMGIDLVLTSLWAATMPKVTAILQEDTSRESSEKLNRYFNAMSSLMVMVCSAMIIVVPPVVLLLIRKPAYHDAIRIFPLAAITYYTRIITYYFTITIFFYRKNSRLIVVYGVLAVIKIALSIPLASYLGIEGVMYSTYISKFVEIVLVLLAGRDLFKYKFNVVKIIIVPLIFFASTLVIYHCFEESKQAFLYLIEFISLGVISAYIYRKELLTSAQRYLKF